MRGIREAQLKINEMNKDGEFTCPVHLALGHEAIAEAVSSAMTKDDLLLCTHRNIHYNIARADNLEYIINQMKEGDGCMNMSNPEKGIIYTSSILGNNLSVACGCALAKKVKGEPGIILVVLGDGSAEEGAFYESLIFAKSFNLSIIFIMENNGWSMSTSIKERRCEIDFRVLAKSLEIQYERIKYDYSILPILKEEARFSPVLLEVMIETLGGYWKTPNKFVNYHSGVVKMD